MCAHFPCRSAARRHCKNGRATPLPSLDTRESRLGSGFIFPQTSSRSQYYYFLDPPQAKGNNPDESPDSEKNEQMSIGSARSAPIVAGWRGTRPQTKGQTAGGRPDCRAISGRYGRGPLDSIFVARRPSAFSNRSSTNREPGGRDLAATLQNEQPLSSGRLANQHDSLFEAHHEDGCRQQIGCQCCRRRSIHSRIPSVNVRCAD